ncbi:phage antirepressor KilAC domain-containing protein [Yersinia alsatica]|uniref:phage antirepressor KilAC domain-containing protein n=1 Tax=Yersinia alsatica TaxID=2890317 RepID=UPI0032EAB6D6
MDSITANKVVSTVPMIAGIEITTDIDGRFNLNALHRASGREKRDGPTYWLALDSTKVLVDELDHQTTGITVVKKEGRYGGTFAHELLAISYAGWISPSFQLRVNQVFLDFRTGKLQSASVALPSVKELAMMVIQAEEEKERLSLENQHLAQQVEVAIPKVEFHDKVVAAPGAMSLAIAAKVLGTGRNRLCQFMRHCGWLTRRNEPYQEKITAGLLDVKLGHWEHPDYGVQQSVTALVTGKGLTLLQRLLKHGEIANGLGK